MKQENTEETDFYEYVMDNYTENKVMIIKLEKRRNWPDRLLFLKNRKVLLIEFKRQDGKLSKGQQILHSKLQRLGQKVITVYSCEQAKQQLDYEVRNI